MNYKYGDQDYKNLLAKSKHSIGVAEILYKNGTMNHNELAKALGIKKNNLTNVIKKLEPFDILFFRRIGKNVYYSLNAKGYEFYDFIINQEKELVTKDKVFVVQSQE